MKKNNQNLKVSIICPIFNADNYICHTINSIINQTYQNFEIIIIDGGSSDSTLSLLEGYKNNIKSLISEPDNGMYDALVKGFKLATGDIMCYLNAGDFLYPHAFEAVADIFTEHDISWITGYRSVCNEKNIITHVDLPFRYTSSLIRVGAYGKTLPYIQQESTFWRKSILDTVDLEYLRQLKLAGDYYLWWSFSNEHQLEVISSPIGVFKKHSGQLSENLSQYNREISDFAERKNVFHWIQEAFEIIFWALHPKLRAMFFKSVLEFEHQRNVWKKT
ncbi:MAG TPA: glycosyltransferase [Methylophaga aminisulfidivorans]|uniref:glycosyltransferase n=2 Tax=Piscirickettsiaceae TaxID=135616 RepID=UPI001A16CA5F|nr:MULTISPECIES: glycosyltransferase [Methylophaga]HIM40887.1 glycosyltransferase [Methylophaga aminisulfidivorans]